MHLHGGCALREWGGLEIAELTKECAQLERILKAHVKPRKAKLVFEGVRMRQGKPTATFRSVKRYGAEGWQFRQHFPLKAEMVYTRPGYAARLLVLDTERVFSESLKAKEFEKAS